MSFLPGWFPGATAAAGGLKTLTQVLSATDNSAGAFTLPVGIQAGDLIVVWDYAIGSSPASVTPSGFTNDINVGNPSHRGMISHKVAVGTEGGTSVNGMDGSAGEVKLTYVFRGDRSITTATALDPASEATEGNPSSQTVNASGSAVPLIVFGGYGADVAIDPRSFSPSKDGEINTTGGVAVGYLAYKIYNSSPADVAVDMDDEGLISLLASCYIRCS